MVLDTAMIAVLITIILALFSFSAWVGALHQKVKANRYDIINIQDEFKDFIKDNKADHKNITDKLDKIIQNGQRSKK